MIASHALEQDLYGHPAIKRPIEAILCRSMLTTYLLIGDMTEAEKVVTESIQLWKPDEDDGEQLFQITVMAAVFRLNAPSTVDLIESRSSDCNLPIELRRVLTLPLSLRLSFVLRVLIGLPLQICAQIL